MACFGAFWAVFFVTGFVSSSLYAALYNATNLVLEILKHDKNWGGFALACRLANIKFQYKSNILNYQYLDILVLV